MKTDSPTVLDFLDEVRAAGTPGEWMPATAPPPGVDQTHAQYIASALRPEQGRPLWLTWAPAVNGVHEAVDYVIPAMTGDGPMSEENAVLVATAVNALPILTAALRAVLDKCDRMEAEAPNPGVRGSIADEFRHIVNTALDVRPEEQS